jgi:O-antigen ligase
MLGVSIGMLSSSGARSSSIALLAGLFVFLYYDRSLIRKYAPLVFSVLVAAALVMPNIQERLESFVFKHAHWAESHAESDAAVDRLIVSRKIVWDAHIDGFNDRPWLGWGFGIDKDTNLTFWGGELTSLGFASRDPVNDILYSAEMGGVFGVTAYLIAIGILFSSWIRNVDIRNAGVSVFQEKDRNRRAKQLCEAQILYLSLSVALFVMFEFDNTALAAGNFFSTLAWITLGCAFVLRQDFYCDVVGSRPIKPPLQDVVQYYRT